MHGRAQGLRSGGAREPLGSGTGACSSMQVQVGHGSCCVSDTSPTSTCTTRVAQALTFIHPQRRADLLRRSQMLSQRPAADALTRLQDRHRVSLGDEAACGDQTANASANNDHVNVAVGLRWCACMHHVQRHTEQQVMRSCADWRLMLAVALICCLQRCNCTLVHARQPRLSIFMLARCSPVCEDWRGCWRRGSRVRCAHKQIPASAAPAPVAHALGVATCNSSSFNEQQALL